MTSHFGGVTREAGARVGVDAVTGILQIVDGQPVPVARIANRGLMADGAKSFIKSEE